MTEEHQIGLDGPLDVEIQEDGIQARLIKPFRVRLKSMGNRVISVPKGFLTNFASVPRIFWNLAPPWGRYSPAAVVHDYLYQSGILDRKVADLAFLILMTELGVPWWERQAIYRAVRLFGGWAWRKCRKQETRLPVNVGGPGKR